jgi:hypothetical protein
VSVLSCVGLVYEVDWLVRIGRVEDLCRRKSWQCNGFDLENRGEARSLEGLFSSS